MPATNLEVSDTTLLDSPKNDGRRVSAFDLVASQPWAIQPQALETIAAIARRENASPEAVAAKLGRPLQNTRSVSVRDGVAVVPVTGPIFRYANLFTEVSGATSLEVLARDYVAAMEDAHTKGAVMVYDTPGGMAAGISEFAQLIRSVRARTGKPVIAYVDNMAASAGYWIAAACDEIVISKTAEVGSIGAVVGYDTRKNEGMAEIVSSQSPKKRPDMSTPEGRSQMQERIDQLAQVFIEDVAAYRGVSVETVLADFGQGDMRMGAEAVRLNMADRVSTLEEVIAGLAGTTNGGFRMDPKKSGQPAAEDKPVITREYLAEHHANLVAAIAAEGAEAARAEATTAERARVQAILSTPLANVYGDLVASAVASGQSHAEFALAVLAEEGKARGATLANLRNGQQPVPQPAAPEPVAVDSLPIEERCKAKWDASAKLQGEFAGNFGAYLAYEQAAAAGKVKVLKTKAS